MIRCSCALLLILLTVNSSATGSYTNRVTVWYTTTNINCYSATNLTIYVNLLQTVTVFYWPGFFSSVECKNLDNSVWEKSDV